MFSRISPRFCFKRRYCQSYKSKESKSEEIPKVKSFGQPTFETHPFLLNDGEIVPGISRSEFQDRRQRLMESFFQYAQSHNKKAHNHLVVIPSSTKQYMSEKIPYVFRQNSDFMYLSGCLEPDTCLVLASTDNSSQHNSTLFMRVKDSHSEIWDGPRTGPEESIQVFGVDQSLPTLELDQFLSFFLKSQKSSLLWYDITTTTQPSVHKVMVNCFKNHNNKSWESPRAFIHKLRAIKSKAEINLMRKSCEIASKAIAKTISASKPGMTEHQLFAKVDYECRVDGAEYLAYPPVVAGGTRGTIIHYINNNQIISDNELVLMDAGCEYHSYTSDITRTWPINGTFTDEQRIIYQIVLDVQLQLIEMCHRYPTLDKLFDFMCLYLGQQLRDAGLVSKLASDKELARMAFQFCPHHVSHYLGMDVHDTPTVPRSINIKPGMVVTIEPGLYFPENSKVPNKFKGLGIRIEDDILITENGPDVLTKNCPKMLSDIERLGKENQ